MNELEAHLLKIAIGFCTFLVAAGSLVSYYALKYLRVLGEAKVEEAESKRAEARAAATARLAKIGEVAAAAAEEQARTTGIKGEEKAALANAIARGMIDASEPESRGRRDLLETAVKAGVTKLRGSIPNGSYSFSGPELEQLVRAASGRPPAPALPPLDAATVKTLPRPPRLPKEPP